MAAQQDQEGRPRRRPVRQGQGQARRSDQGHAEGRQGRRRAASTSPTRHRKPTQANPQGGLERSEAPLHVSKVAIEDPKTGKPTRVRFETQDGKKVRVAVRSGEKIDG